MVLVSLKGQQDYLGAGSIKGAYLSASEELCETPSLYLCNFAWDGAGTETWAKLSWRASGLLKRKLKYTRGAIMTRQNGSEEQFGGVGCVVVQGLLDVSATTYRAFKMKKAL